MKNLCCVISGPHPQSQIDRASPIADLLELRLDLLEDLNLRLPLPYICTCRTEEQLQKALTLKPSYIDLPFEMARPLPVPLIASYHDFEKTPDLNALSLPSADLIKIATYAKSPLDTLRLFDFGQKRAHIIAIAMGPYGMLTRMAKSPIRYACLGSPVAPGQLSLSFLKSIQGTTPIYALIGDPLDKSPSHITHNRFLQKQGLYVKLPVKKEHLSAFFSRDLPFEGFSVTAPLKEAVIPYLDTLDSEAAKIGAVNTIVCNKGFHGYNTDGEGALSLLDAKNKHIVVLGAGGLARAIVYQALKIGARVTVVNRTYKKAKALGSAFGCQVALSPPACDILINATANPDPLETYPPSAILFETNHGDTPFLQKGGDRTKVLGNDLFIAQAARQFHLWKGWNLSEVF